MERLAPENDGRDRFLCLSLEGPMSAALRGEDWGGMEMLLLPCVGTFEEDMQLGTRWFDLIGKIPHHES